MQDTGKKWLARNDKPFFISYNYITQDTQGGFMTDKELICKLDAMVKALQKAKKKTEKTRICWMHVRILEMKLTS